jgi:flagellin-like hook-associated protein FlgL
VDSSGFTITNGNLSATLDLTGLETLEDVLNAINTSGTEVVATLRADGRTIAVRSTLAGADLFISEGGGTTAADLGLIIPGEELPLDRLHGGRGIQTVDGADFEVTLVDGTSFSVDVSGAETLGDVVEIINTHPGHGGLLTAEVVVGENRLRLTDTSPGFGALAVSPLNGSFAASNLGIELSSPSGVIDGTDLKPGGVRLRSAFDGFTLLYQALLDSDPGGISRALRALEDVEQSLLGARAEVGGRLRGLEISRRRTELETFEMKNLISQEGDTDFAEAIVNFRRQETLYQASLQTAARLVQQSLLDFLAP